MIVKVSMSTSGANTQTVDVGDEKCPHKWTLPLTSQLRKRMNGSSVLFFHATIKYNLPRLGLYAPWQDWHLPLSIKVA